MILVKTEEFGSAPELVDSTSAFLRVTFRRASGSIFNPVYGARHRG